MARQVYHDAPLSSMPSPWQCQARLKYFSDPRGRKGGGLSPIPLSRSIPSSLVIQWACIWLVERKEKEVWSIRQGVIDQWSSVTFDISPIRTVLSRAKDGDLGSVFVGKTWEDMYLFLNADLKTQSVYRKEDIRSVLTWLGWGGGALWVLHVDWLKCFCLEHFILWPQRRNP